MHVRKILSFIACCSLVAAAQSEEDTGPEKRSFYGSLLPAPYFPFTPQYQAGGFIWLNTHGNTRQCEFFENGNYILYPLADIPDHYGCDINTQPFTVITGVETQVYASMWTDDLSWCNKATAYIECDWTGINDTTPGLLLLRHAYGLLEWDHCKVLFGQFWQPMFNAECYPDVVSYNGGAPIEAIVRAPQARVNLLWGGSELMLYAGSQSLPFVSQGPAIEGLSTPSTAYIRDGVMPNFHTQYRYNTDNSITAAFFDVKRIVPRLVNAEGNKVNESLVSYSGGAYSNIKYEHGKVSLKAFYAQNPTDWAMIGGYAVSCVDENFDRWSYAATQCVNAWVDWEHYHGDLLVGLFAGVTKNLGTTHNLTPVNGSYLFFARDPNIDYVWRVAPRVWYTASPFRIAFELEFTQAAYGTIEHDGKIRNAKAVNNLSVGISTYYFF